MGIETILLGATLAGGALSAAGSIQKGQAAKQAADFNASVDQQRAASTQDVANAEASDFITKGSDTLQSGVASQGATGVTGQGSPLMVDEATIRAVATGAARKIAGGTTQAGRLQDDANLQKMRGDAAVTGSYLDAGSSLLTSVGKYAGAKSGLTVGGSA